MHEIMMKITGRYLSVSIGLSKLVFKRTDLLELIIAQFPLQGSQMQAFYVDPTLCSTITNTILTSELRLLEMNKHLTRKVYDNTPVLAGYTLTDYSKTLFPIMEQMVYWGKNHREKIIEK